MCLFKKNNKPNNVRIDGIRPNSSVCERCGINLKYINKSNIFEIEGKKYCDACAEYLKNLDSAPKSVCPDCKQVFPISELMTINGKKYCRECARKHYITKEPQSDILNMIITDAVQTEETDLQEEMLNDISFIKEIRHIKGPWQQYDILLASRGYGWDYMVDSAAYLESADLDAISTITTASMANMPETELIGAYRKTQGSINNFDRLSVEQGQLALGGISRVLKAPVKIVWFNQTRVLRIFTTIDDDILITKYVETVIRRTFGTGDAMKLAKPVPAEEQ